MSAIPGTVPIFANENWQLPSRGRVGMFALIIGESAIFTIFVVAYIYYIGRSTYGPGPQILEIPIFNSICLISSSLTIVLAEHAIKHGRLRAFAAWWALTMLLGLEFLAGTAMEWRRLIFEDHLTIRTNLFGTTFYSLVGLHATHVIVGMTGLSLVMLFTVLGRVEQRHAARIQVLALYWHFVDAVWVVVFTVVYIVGR
ncbi:MAG: cytochrome c oxidase subunit 3 [Terracidiphilus sp.]|jgi:cytochrome c oxidase subunit 3/cytochrome o ubiquinol oxidase subunit 3